MKTAVVGHVEWVEFVRVERMPSSGEIVHAADPWSVPAGGGPAAAMQLLKLSGDTIFFTAVGNDELGERAIAELTTMGLDVRAAIRDEPTRRAITHVDARGERTITVIGDRLEPGGADDLPWSLLAEIDAVYFTAGDRAALTSARAARTLVATSRVLPALKGVALDALVGSDLDAAEIYRAGDLEPPPGLVVRTRGGEGGTFQTEGGEPRAYLAAVPPDTIVDRYGAGDAFAAGLTFGLGSGMDVEAAVTLGARCGAAVLGGRGPYEGQPTASDLGL